VKGEIVIDIETSCQCKARWNHLCILPVGFVMFIWMPTHGRRCRVIRASVITAGKMTMALPARLAAAVHAKAASFVVLARDFRRQTKHRLYSSPWVKFRRKRTRAAMRPRTTFWTLRGRPKLGDRYGGAICAQTICEAAGRRWLFHAIGAWCSCLGGSSYVIWLCPSPWVLLPRNIIIFCERRLTGRCSVGSSISSLVSESWHL